MRYRRTHSFDAERELTDGRRWRVAVLDTEDRGPVFFDIHVNDTDTISFSLKRSEARGLASDLVAVAGPKPRRRRSWWRWS